ncbi:hypothetical protein K438DRAFT_2015861, partial [Mycena galopus ATCC 62051]
ASRCKWLRGRRGSVGGRTYVRSRLRPRDRHRTRPGRWDGRTDGQPSRPVPGLLVFPACRPVAGRQQGRPSRPPEDGGRTDDSGWKLRVNRGNPHSLRQCI